MRLSIKISAWIFVIILLLGLLFLLTIINLQRETSTRDFKEFGTVLANTIYDDLRHDMLEDRREHIQPGLESLEKQHMINEVSIYSWNRRIAFSAKEDEIGKKVKDDKVLNVLKNGKRIERIEKKYGQQEFCILIPVNNETACQGCHVSAPSVLGVIEVGVSMALLSQHLERDAKSATILLIVACSLILVSVLIFLRQTVLKRLSLIVRSIREFTAGNYTSRVAIKSTDELGLVGDAFDTMAAKIQRTIEQLEQAHKQLDHSLMRFGKLLATTFELDKIAGVILNEFAENVKASQAAILLRGKDMRLVLLDANGIPREAIEKYNRQPYKWKETSPGYSALQGKEYIFVNRSRSIDKSQDRQVFPRISGLHEQNDFYIFPLISSKETVGVLTLVPPFGERLPEEKIRMIQILCHEAATAILNVAMHKLLKKVSITDDLTELYNQRHFFKVLREEMNRAKRYGHSFSLLFLDLDKFKLFNDSFGHRAGDRILYNVSRLIRRLVRSSDKVFRYGGDEFALILPETHGDEAIILANRIREEINRTNFAPVGKKTGFGLSASVGAVSFDGSRFSAPDEVFKAVDDALHEAKRAGRDKVVTG